VSAVTFFPVWLNTADEALLGNVFRAQLEKNSLLAPGAENSAHFQILTREPTRTLVSGLVLNTKLAEPLLQGAISDFDLALRFYPLPEDSLLFWREDHRLIVAITHGAQLIYAQTLSQPLLNADTLTELRCLILILENQNVLPVLQRVVLWSEFSHPEISLLQQALEMRSEVENPPSPRLPSPRWPLIPLAVRAKNQLASTRERQRSIWKMVGLVYLLIAAAATGYTGWLAWHTSVLRHKVEAIRPTVTTLRQVAARWDALESALTPTLYPAEQLFQAAQVLPPEGVRLTLFQSESGSLLITGEAKNAPAAYKYFEDVKKQSIYASWTWQMPQPRILPNDSAQFRIEGKR
jgi:hypothetical protein